MENVSVKYFFFLNQDYGISRLFQDAWEPWHYIVHSGKHSQSSEIHSQSSADTKDNPYKSS